VPKPARLTWTDERLDDFAHRMEQGFERLERDIRSGFARLDEEMRAVNMRIDALQRTMLLMMVTILAGFAGLIVTQA
jgi:hypothetical protein